tara:strand:+ start:24 stop:143 length:120 start_codon:yes stop_codon:yes gene_type:complete
MIIEIIIAYFNKFLITTKSSGRNKIRITKIKDKLKALVK